MATDVERLVVSLEASITKYERAMNKALNQTNNTARKIESRFAGMGRTISGSFGKILALTGAGITFAGAERLVDTATKIQNTLKVAGLEGENLTQVYDALFASAQRNAAPIETLAELYSRAALSAKDLGASQADLIEFTDKVALSLRVSGQSAEQSAGALLQLGQALGDGMVQAQEYNSLLDGAQPLLRAVAAGLEEAGGSVSKLTKLVKSGKVSSEAFFRAFLAGSSILDEQVASSQLTISQSFQRVENALVDVVGRFNSASGAGQRFADSMSAIADAIDSIDIDGLIGKIGELKQTMHELGNADIFKKLNDLFGLNTPEAIRAHGLIPVQSGNAGDVLAGTFATLSNQPQDKALAAELAARAGGGSVKPVSLKDSAPPKATGSRGGRSPGERFGSDIQAIEARTKSLEAQIRVQSQLNPLVNDYGYALTKAQTVQDLLNEAEKRGVAVTPELRAKIDSVAEGYANATVEAAKLAEAQDNARQTMEDWAGLGRDVMRGFIDDLIEGKSATDALGDALSNIGNILLNAGLNALMGSIFPSSGNLFGGFRASGGPVQPGRAYVVGEQRPELFVPQSAGTILPTVPKAGGGMNVTFAPVIDARGAAPGVERQIMSALDHFSRFELPHRVNRIMADPLARGAR